MTLKFQVNYHLFTCCTSVERAIICNFVIFLRNVMCMTNNFNIFFFFGRLSLQKAVCYVGSLIVDVIHEMGNLQVNRIVGGKFWFKNLW